VDPARAAVAGPLGFSAGLLVGAPGLTDLQQTLPLVWLILVLSIIGAGITWGVLAYTLWKFRDPATKGRRYG
jgi:hypothetical protein